MLENVVLLFGCFIKESTFLFLIDTLTPEVVQLNASFQ
jgi:hypothetical protein